MTVENLLSRLEKVKRTGPGRWQARCPAHDDKGPSLSVRELDSGVCLVHCFAGCSAADVIGAAGIDMAELFPPRETGDHHTPPERRPFPASDVLRAVAFETTVVLCAATAMLAGEPLSTVDRDRLSLASSRLQAALDAAGLRHG